MATGYLNGLQELEKGKSDSVLRSGRIDVAVDHDEAESAIRAVPLRLQSEVEVRRGRSIERSSFATGRAVVFEFARHTTRSATNSIQRTGFGVNDPRTPPDKFYFGI